MNRRRTPIYAMPMVIEYVDTLASAAMQADSDADDEAELREI